MMVAPLLFVDSVVVVSAHMHSRLLAMAITDRDSDAYSLLLVSVTFGWDASTRLQKCGWSACCRQERMRGSFHVRGVLLFYLVLPILASSFS